MPSRRRTCARWWRSISKPLTPRASARSGSSTGAGSVSSAPPCNRYWRAIRWSLASATPHPSAEDAGRPSCDFGMAEAASAGDQNLLHPAAALARLHLQEAVLFLAREDHLLALVERGDDGGGIRRLRHDAYVADLGLQHITLVEDGPRLPGPSGRRLLGEGADVALQAGIGAHGPHDAVVVVGEAGGDDLALVRVRVAPEGSGAATASTNDAQHPTEIEVGLAGAALGRRHLDTRSGIGEQHARLRFLELEAAGDAAPDGSHHRAVPAEERPEAAQATAHATRVVLREDHGGSEDEIGGHHLATTHVGVLAELTGVAEGALLHHVLHARAPLHHDEAVGLLDHQPDEADRRAKLVARERPSHVVLGLHDGEGSHRLVTALQIGAALGPARSRRSLDDAPSLALLHVGDALPVSRDCCCQDTRHQRERQSVTPTAHAPRPPSS